MSIVQVISSSFLAVSYAAASPVTAAAQSGGDMSQTQFWTGTLWFFFIGLTGFYLFVTLPALKREDAKKKFLDGLKKNDEVMTSGGILGRVVSTGPEAITVEIAQNVRVRVAPSHVAAPPKKEDAPPKGKPAEKAKA